METANISRAKWEFTFWCSGLTVESRYGYVRVTKVVMVDFGEKVKVTCHGQMASGYGPRSVVFNISGYDNHPEAPDWLIDLIKEAGGKVRPQ